MANIPCPSDTLYLMQVHHSKRLIDNNDNNNVISQMNIFVYIHIYKYIL